MISKEAVNRLIEELDGHSIFRPGFLIELGLPIEAVDDLTQEHKSSNCAGGQLTTNGRSVESIFGICGLDALRWLAKAVEADTKSCQAIGRGRLAELYKEAILAAV